MKLYLMRDLRCLFQDRQTVLLPFLFFLIAFFLFSFLEIISVGKYLPTFQVLMTLSTVGFIGRALHRDFSTGILDIILDHTPSLMPFLIAKFLSIAVFQGGFYLSTWIILSVFAPHEFWLGSPLQPLIALTALSLNLSLLILLADALLLKLSSSSFLGIILILPFILPIILVSSLTGDLFAIKAPAFLIFYTLSFVMLGLNAVAFILKQDRFS